MKPNKIAILVNLDARQGVAEKLWNKISRNVMDSFPDNTEVVTYNIPCDFEKILLDLVRNKDIDGFVSAGGDGSLNELLNVLMKMNKNNPVPFYLGSIGLGSSNDYLKPKSSKIHNIPVKINWVKNILTDIGMVEFEGVHGDLEIRYFIINANMGVTASANYMFNHPGKILRVFKKKWVSAAILLTAIKGILNYQNYEADLKIDETRRKHIKLSNLSVIKNPNISGSFKYEQKIEMNDNYLGLNYCDGMNKIEILTTLFGLMKGKFRTNSKRKTFKIRSLNVLCEKLVHLETDGEVFLGKKFSFKVIPNAIYTMGL